MALTAIAEVALLHVVRIDRVLSIAPHLRAAFSSLSLRGGSRAQESFWSTDLDRAAGEDFRRPAPLDGGRVHAGQEGRRVDAGSGGDPCVLSGGGRVHEERLDGGRERRVRELEALGAESPSQQVEDRRALAVPRALKAVGPCPELF